MRRVILGREDVPGFEAFQLLQGGGNTSLRDLLDKLLHLRINALRRGLPKRQT